MFTVVTDATLLERLSCKLTKIRTRAIAVYYTEMPSGQRCKMVSFDPKDKNL